jgi:hypothetical protein
VGTGVSRYGLISGVLVAAILAIAAAVWGVGRSQARADESSTHAISAGQQMLIAMLDQETGLRGYINTHDIVSWSRTEPVVHTSRPRSPTSRRTPDRPSGPDRASLQQLAEQEITAMPARKHPHVADALRRKAVMDRFRAVNADFLAKKQADRDHDRSTAETISIIAILLLGAAFGTVSWVLFERPARRNAHRRRRRAEFADALQVARCEHEAFNVLKRHLEGWLQKARAVVMIRNASHNRLEPATSLEAKAGRTKTPSRRSCARRSRISRSPTSTGACRRPSAWRCCPATP